MAGDNARNTEHAWRNRAEESSAHQAAAAGMGPPPGLGGTHPMGGGGRGTPVYVTGASNAFVQQVGQSWGSGRQGGGEGGTPGSSYDPVISDQRAIGELNRQMTEDLKVTADFVLREQANAARAMTSLAQDMRSIRQEERDHMQAMLDLMAANSDQQLRVAQAIQQAYAGVGAAGGAPVTSGSPSPRRTRGAMGARPRTTPGGTPIGGGAGGGAGGGGFVPTPVPRPRRVTLGTLRRGFFNGINNQFGIPAANAAQQAPTGMQAMISNIAGPMSSMGMRAIPGVGTAIAAVGGMFDAMEWLTEQRQANAQYQQIYSGSNFGLTDTIEGLFGGDVNTGSGQRAAGFNFRMSQLFSSGGLTGENADRLFQGVSALGFNNDERRQQLQFGTQMYKTEGMSVDDSLKVINVSAQYANQSLAGVAKSLQTVSKAAQETGQSAKTLRDTFTGYYGAALAGGAGASASSIAQAMTLSTGGMTRQLANANMTPMLTNSLYLQQIATGAGMTSGQLQSQMAQGNFQAFTGSAQKILDQRMLGVMDPSVRKRFTQLVGEFGGNEVVAEGPGAISRIATELMGERGWNVYAARSALQSIGVDTSAMNDQQVTEFFVAQMTSGGLGAQGKKQAEENRPKDISGQIEEHGVSDFELGTMNEFSGKTKFGSKSAQEYIKHQKKTGKTDPAMEAAINQFGGNDQKVKVQTKQGARIVTMGEAIRDYSDQISTGSAIIAEGEHEGKKISEVTGVTSTGVVPGKGGTPDTAKQDAKSGQKVEDFEKGRDITKNAFGNEGGGVVRIEPTPELSRMFNFTASGNVEVDSSAAQGVPPTVQGPIK